MLPLTMRQSKLGKTFRRSKEGEVYQDKDRRNTKAAASCLHGGDCEYCQGNRHHKHDRAAPFVSTEETTIELAHELQSEELE